MIVIRISVVNYKDDNHFISQIYWMEIHNSCVSLNQSTQLPSPLSLCACFSLFSPILDFLLVFNTCPCIDSCLNYILNIANYLNKLL